MNLFNVSAPDLTETTESDIVEEPVDSVIDDTEELDNDETIEEATEEEATDEAEETTEEPEDVFIVDGEEFTGEQLRNAKEIESVKKSLQADYTKKTMALADERKALESKTDNLDKLAQELEVLVGEDSEVDWAQLKEDDIYEYTERKEKADKRAKKLKEVKSNLASQKPELSQEEVAQEQQKLVEAFPEWVKKDSEGNVTEILPQYQTDLAEMSKHALELGFTEAQLSEINTAPIIKALMNSMRAKGKAEVIKIAKKKVAPKSTKPAKKAPKQEVNSLFSKSITQSTRG
jgi:cobalamin biosynthesis protein CbiD